MFKVILYNLLWFLTLTSTAFTASESVRTLLEGTITELMFSLTLMFLSIGSFVSIDYTIKKEEL